MWLHTENKKAKPHSCNLERLLHKTECWKVRRNDSNKHFKLKTVMLIVLIMAGISTPSLRLCY